MTLTSAINGWAVRQAEGYEVLHAGAVVRGGAAVLLPAGSGSGKTTLTAGLLTRGFRLFSDEVAAIDVASGQLVGYPRALSVRRDVLPLFDVSAVGFAADRTAAMLPAGAFGGQRARGAAGVPR